ncbi:aldehyde dehydrogenase family protein [Actinomadura rugatobispora]|uniref:Aldehyde dehydrogenase family protein n=1 Tax=Actinomadura rugatobispora TaxID=1994 RepID=A0ABW0ZTD7_9ACTN|nr:aldehyde dehydrogenase family protein [Actinomadura rugatobispora]
MKQYEWDRLYIDGAWRPPHEPTQADVIGPATERVIGRVPVATAKDAEDAVLAARVAFEEGPWPRLTYRERAEVLLKMSGIMVKRRDELAGIDSVEVGRTRAATTSFVDVPIERWIDLMERVVPGFEFVEPMLPNIVGSLVGQGVVHREPFGVVSAISPFNAPWMLSLFKLGPAMVAGCTTVLMPSPLAPLSAFVLAEIADEAGLPAGVLNLVTGSPEVGEVITTHEAVDLVSFTGSDATGRRIMAQAAPTLKKVVLELGGKSANIVLEDADLDRVATDVLRNFTANCGQGCGMLTRTLVHRSLHDELVERVTALASGVKIGDPATDPTVTVGPIISAGQRERVESMIARGVEEGARIAVGGKRPEGLDTGYFLEPTVMVDVENSMSVAQDEFFGPVMVVIPFDDDEEAIKIANDSRYGLAGGVWSRDVSRAYSVAQRIRTGSVAVNGGGGRVTPHGPFGGYKHSGLGREWGRWGLEEYLQHKTITWPVAAG